MPYKNNTYYKISAFGNDAVGASESLLKSYPLTKVCLEILGKKLLNLLEFGFFAPEYQVIRQGDKGKDLYLLCNHLADVLVFNKVIVQMEAPALFGDKAIIDRNSTRNATIAIAENNDALIMKIPLGHFLRDFKDVNLEDISFRQETQIFYNLFLEIQNRLFKYAQIQQLLWDEVNKQLRILNIQLLSNSLIKKENKEWGPKIWQVIHQYLQSVHKFSWPNSVNYDSKTLIEILNGILEKKFPRSSYRGSEQTYQYQKQLIWKRWLETLCELLVKVLPNDQLPVNIGEIQLFNPKIYQMRMHTLLVSIQRKFMFRKVPPRKDVFDSDKLKAKNFFSSKSSDNEFDLQSYLDTLKEMFVLKNPNRVLAQVAQQTAQLSATCENEFNTSVSQMQHFIERVRKLANIKKDENSEEEIFKKELADRILIIHKGFVAYSNSIVGHTYTYAGIIRFAEAKVPLLADILKTCGSAQLKTAVTKAFISITKKLTLAPVGFTETTLQNQFYICQGSPEDIIPESQIATHYWIPISDGITLKKGDKEFGPLKPGTIVGGASWAVEQEIETGSNAEEWSMVMPKKQKDDPPNVMFLLFVLPKKMIPWLMNSEPIPEEFTGRYLPLLQWMINKYLESLSLISELRDTLLKKYSQVVEVVVIEKKVHEFESNKNKIPPAKYNRILKLVYEILGTTLERRESISSETLSKQIYNEILKQTKRDYPKINPEGQGNKAYTLWRFVQSEIISKVFADEFSEKVKIKPPKSVFLQIREQIDELLKEKNFTIEEGALEFTEGSGSIELQGFLKTDRDLLIHESLNLVVSILQILEQQLHTITEETTNYRSRLKQISSIQTEFDVNEIQSQFIIEAITKLQDLLKEKFNQNEDSPL